MFPNYFSAFGKFLKTKFAKQESFCILLIDSCVIYYNLKNNTHYRNI